MEFWIFIAAIYLIYLVFFKKKNGKASGTYAAKSQTSVKTSSKKWLSDNEPKVATVRQEDYEDDDLPAFTLSNERTIEYRITSTTLNQSYKKNGTLARWLLPGEGVIIGEVEITSGLIYVGQRMKPRDKKSGSYYDDNSEASLIDDNLKVRLTPYNYEDNSLGYWPSYSSLSSNARGAYLNWLSSDRNDASCPIGYVFIYLYGLERRALIDSQDEKICAAEFQTLFSEVYRLRNVFNKNRSFSNYTAQLLEAMTILRPELNLEAGLHDDINFSNGMQFKLKLAQTVDAEKPVSAEQALMWLIYHTEYTLRTPARRCTKEFAALFKQKYGIKYGDGLVIKSNKTRLRFDYTPASPSLRGVRLPVPNLPDPSVLKGPIQKIVVLAEVCTEALDAYSRYLGRKGTSENDTAAIMLLPAEIINESAGEVLTKFKHWADSVISNNQGLASVADFWLHMGASRPVKINKKETDLMHAFAQRMGYRVAPDPQYHHVKADAEGALVLFPSGNGARFAPSSAFISAVLTLRLGVIVALTDSSLEQAEMNVLENTIDRNTGFTDDEKCSLRAYLTWQLNTPPNMTGMKNSIALLSTTEKSVIGQFIVGVACSDGKIEPTEIKQLEKIYTSLGLDPASISSSIHHHSTADITKLSAGESGTRSKTEFALDASVLARHESATDDVRKLLSTIFTEDELETQENVLVSDLQSNSLDDAHNQLYLSLLEKGHWSRSEATELCQRYNLMLGGALEVINDWSYAVVDAPVLDDDDDDIWIDLEIAKELEG